MANDATCAILPTSAQSKSDVGKSGLVEREVRSGKLPLWAPDNKIPETNAEPVDTHTFRMRDEPDDPSLRGGAYEVLHYGKEAYGHCFGPLALDQILSFCHIMEERLKNHCEVVVAPSTCDAAEYANTAVLFGGFLILKRGWSAERVVGAYPIEAGLFFLCSWVRKSDQPPQLKVQDCWNALAMAVRLNWISATALEDPFLGNIVCQQYRRVALSYDAAWLVPGLVLVSADPISTVRDPNPRTVAALALPERDVRASDDLDCCRPKSRCSTLANLLEEEPKEASIALVSQPASCGVEESCSNLSVSPCKELTTGQSTMLRSASNSKAWLQARTSMLDERMSGSMSLRSSNDGFGYAASSVHTVCKAYHKRASYSYDELELPPKDFATWIKEQRVGLMLRVNFGNEAGLKEHGGSYDSAVFRKAGLKHLDLPYEDTNGAIPEPRKVLRFFNKFHSSCVDERPAVFVHCKGGFGRSVLFCCLLIINVYDVPGREVLAWVRVARPGSITTLSQERFLCALSGREALDGWLATGCCGCGMM